MCAVYDSGGYIIRFTEESKQKVISFVEEKYLSPEVYQSLWTASRKEHLVQCFKKYLSVNEFSVAKFWTHISQNIWVSHETIFDRNEIFFIKSILNEGGVVTMHWAKKNLFTPYQAYRVLDTLCEKKIVCILDLENKERIIIFHPEFVHEV